MAVMVDKKVAYDFHDVKALSDEAKPGESSLPA